MSLMNTKSSRPFLLSRDLVLRSDWLAPLLPPPDWAFSAAG